MDDYRGYVPMSRVLPHAQVKQSIGEYARVNIHTNTAEGFFAILKRVWYGQFHHYNTKYAPLYITEPCFKYNNKHAISNHKDTGTSDKLIRRILCTS